MIPAKVSVKILEMVTIGFAKEVDDVNQYPAVINNATAVATEFLSFSLTYNMVSISPVVAIISLKSNDNILLSTLNACLEI